MNRHFSINYSVFHRLVVQATPPFLVIHANAAYATASGFDSHLAIGKPLSHLMSLPKQRTLCPSSRESLDMDQQSTLPSSEIQHGLSLTSLQDVPFEILVASSGFGYHHEVNLHVSDQFSMRRDRQQYGNKSSNDPEGCRNLIPCVMAVSPVVPSRAATLSWNNMKGGIASGNHIYYFKTSADNRSNSGTSTMSASQTHSEKMHHQHHSYASSSSTMDRKFEESNDNKVTHFAVQIDPLIGKKKTHMKSKFEVNGRSVQGRDKTARMTVGSKKGDESDESSLHRSEIIAEPIRAENIDHPIPPSNNAHSHQQQIPEDHNMIEDQHMHQAPMAVDSTDDEHSSSTGTKHVITCG